MIYTFSALPRISLAVVSALCNPIGRMQTKKIEGKGYSVYDIISADSESPIPLDLSPGGSVIKSSRKTPGVLQPARQPVTFALDVFSALGDLVVNLRKVFDDGGRVAGKTCWGWIEREEREAKQGRLISGEPLRFYDNRSL